MVIEKDRMQLFGNMQISRPVDLQCKEYFYISVELCELNSLTLHGLVNDRCLISQEFDETKTGSSLVAEISGADRVMGTIRHIYDRYDANPPAIKSHAGICNIFVDFKKMIKYRYNSSLTGESASYWLYSYNTKDRNKSQSLGKIPAIRFDNNFFYEEEARGDFESIWELDRILDRVLMVQPFETNEIIMNTNRYEKLMEMAAHKWRHVFKGSGENE